jgi:hypothetical protein
LKELFSGSSVSGRSFIGVRDTLLRNGFTQGITQNRQGYFFINLLNEQVRIMRRGNAWEIRIRNRDGYYLDEFSNAAPPGLTRGITVFSF